MHLRAAGSVPARLRLLSLSEDVLVEPTPDGRHLLALTQWGEIWIDESGPVVREALRRMSLGPVSVENLPTVGDSFLRWRNGTADEPGGQVWRQFNRVLDALGACVVQSLGLDGEAGPVLSVVPASRYARFWHPPDVDPDRPIRLSRFVAMRESDGELLLESPLAQHRVVLHLPVAAWVVGSLGGPTTVSEMSLWLKIARPVLADVVSYLVASSMVQTGEPDEPLRFAEDRDPDLIPWSHHDLQFHAHTRAGRNGGQSGAVFPSADLVAAAPATRPKRVGRRLALYRPASPDLVGAGPPPSPVVEAIRPRHDFSERPVTAEQLGELLFRATRSRQTRSATARGGADHETAEPPSQSAVDLSELELYLTLDRCAGLPRGNYHYEPGDHALTLVSDAESGLAELADIAKAAAGSTRRPPVLITIASRIARLSWLYSGVAYSTTLKQVGALQHTLQLTATAMGLASWVPAGGDGATADKVLGLDWPAEVSVGEFVAGHIE